MTQLETLLQQCTVKLSVAGGWGTGFFVAPGLILTCAHVVRKAADLKVAVFYPARQQTLLATVQAKVDDGKTLDMALVKLSEPLSDHPCVLLEEESVAIGQPLYSYGYSESYTNAAPVCPINEGLTGDTPPLLKLQGAQIERGISGAALLNLKTCKVCGMLKETRAANFDLGGGAIPTHVILEQFPDLRELQQRFHQNDRRWSNLTTQSSSSVALKQNNQSGTNYQIQPGTSNTNIFGGNHYYLSNAEGSSSAKQSTGGLFPESESIKRLKEQINRPLDLPSISNTQTFGFEVIAIDAHGREVARYQKQSKLIVEELSGTKLEMVVIPGGTFTMGSSDKKAPSSERPAHSVTVQPFLMSKYPITKAQWRAVIDLLQVNKELSKRPSLSGGANYPVTKVSWYDAVEFCDRLSRYTEREYRLPTEAEWEYACRAGTIDPFHFGETITSNLANYDASKFTYRSEPKGKNRGEVVEVGSFPSANSFGLFDMHGNVLEWCLDHYHKDYSGAPTDGNAWVTAYENRSRILRGGSWLNDSKDCRSSYRSKWEPDEGLNRFGFRVVCPIKNL